MGLWPRNAKLVEHNKSMIEVLFEVHETDVLRKLKNMEYPIHDDSRTYDSYDDLKSAYMSHLTSVLTGGGTFFMPCETAIKTASSIRLELSDKFNAIFLSKIPDGRKFTYLMGKHKFFSALKENGIIRAYCVWFEQRDDRLWYLMYDSASFNTKTGDYSLGERLSPLYKNENMLLFLKLMTFIELSDLVTAKLKPGAKHVIGKEKYINESGADVCVIVDSKWNVCGVRTDGFGVSGHLRLQACGKDLNDRKLIYVEEFQKTGYVRTAGKVRAGMTDLKNENE